MALFGLVCTKSENRAYFPDLVSYNRFLEIQGKALMLLSGFLVSKRGKCTGISFVDSTSLSICNVKRCSKSQVFKGLAAKGRSSKGWFYGFKLHLVINHHGEILAANVTSGNVHDLVPTEGLAKRLFGKLFGDKGYLSKTLFEKLFDSGVQLFSGIRKTMKNKLLKPYDALLMKKRSLIETVNKTPFTLNTPATEALLPFLSTSYLPFRPTLFPSKTLTLSMNSPDPLIPSSRILFALGSTPIPDRRCLRLPIRLQTQARGA